MGEMPKDPMTAQAEAAAAMHEVFKSYVEAGFTEAQALYIIGQMMAATMRPSA